MSITFKTFYISLLIISLITSVGVFARGGGFGGGAGGFHDDGGFHGNDNGGFHDNNGYNYHGYDNGYHNNVEYYSGVVVGVPVDGGDDSDCEPSQVCNSYGQCWTEQQCD